ncbi:BFH_collapsed_G0023640.mRNA.1.CDS.1 [Saccharomyces cerevisiae]|nr:BGN_3a_G0023290.mRNA.1.CDS.1 [Saccharomyces cerevisiae]CAI7145104.1 BGN_3a_G0023290.mRNA.1.CDS.1 [Saccharomyces cerevisiae]CAI7149071.1 BFH_collapsed_G0023640.mRNA.1.CDS.1 [Saccharomyces cerevisiae]
MPNSHGNVLNNISLNSKQNPRSISKSCPNDKDARQKSFKTISAQALVRVQGAGYKLGDVKLKDADVKEKNSLKKYDCKNATQEKKEQEQVFEKTVAKGSVQKYITKTSKTNSLFIGNLKSTVTEEMLRKIFKRYQSFESAKVCRDFLTKKSLGYGYLNFKDKNDAESARKEFNYTVFFGQEVKIMPSMKNTLFRKNIGTNVFFSNLPLENPQLTTRSFYLIMIEYGNVLSCLLERRKNIGFVYFDNDISARNVIKKYNNQEFFGNKIICGLHFDKEVRARPEFTKRKKMIGSDIVIEDELLASNNLSDNARSKTILVKNLPSDTTQEEVLDYFSTIGPIKSVFISEKQANTPHKAFVTYKNEEESKKAQKCLNKTIFKNHTIWVGPGKDKPVHNQIGTNKKTKVYLKNLSFNCNKEFISQLCLQEKIRFSEIKITNYNSLNWTFCGHVECFSRSDAERLFNILDRRLIGSSLVEASWSKNNDNILNEIDYDDGNNNENYKKLINISSMMRFRTQELSAHQKGLTSQFQQVVSPFSSYSNSYTNMNSLVATPMKPHPAFNLITNTVDEKLHQPKRTKQENAEILESLKKIINRNLQRISISGLNKEENLRSISEFIFDVFWEHDSERLSHFLLMTNTSLESQKILQKQVTRAAESLGFTV